jgi:hypothetical protein
VTEDGGAGVFLVARLTKFLAGRGFIVIGQGTVRRPNITRLGTRVCSGELSQKRHVVTRRRVTVHILFKYQICNYELFDSKNYELFVFLLIFRCCFMGPNF